MRLKVKTVSCNIICLMRLNICYYVIKYFFFTFLKNNKTKLRVNHIIRPIKMN